MRRTLAVTIAGVGLAVGVYSLRVARDEPAYSFAGSSAIGVVALLGAGFALMAAGLAVWLRRPSSRAGPLLAVAGVAWFLLEWDNPGIGSAAAFTTGLCLYALCPAVVGHAVLVHSRMRRRAFIAAAYAGSVFVLGLLPALFFDPAAEGCSDCPRNLVLVRGNEHAVTDLHRAGIYFGIAWAGALAVAGTVNLVRSAGPTRPVLAAGAVYLALVTAIFVASRSRGFLWNGTLERRLWLGEAAALALLGAGVGWSLLAAHRARSAVARLVVDLAQAPPAGGLRDALATIVGDPELVLAYPLSDSGRLVDADGRPLERPEGATTTSVVRDGRPVAVLAHAPGLLDDEQLVEEVTAAARLALENERLQAEVRVRLGDLRASRSRIVAAADAERKRLERDLHDGAQQRLVALALSLRLLRSQLGGDSEIAARLDEAEAELESAISELRDLAHGIFPAVLGDGGLAVAVRALAEEGQVPIRVGELPVRRYPPAVETAAYTVVAEAARTATGAVLVGGRQSDGVLVIEVETDAELQTAAAVELEDRLGALDGQLALRNVHGGRLTIRAEIPCES